MMKQGLISNSFLLFLFYNCTIALSAESPAQAPSQSHAKAPAKAPTSMQTAVEPPSEVPLVPAPPQKALTAGPIDVSKILEKAGSFSVFIRLLKSTSVSIQIEKQLNVSNTLTIFAPTNGAFSALKSGTLNSLSSEQKVQLVQYHILPSSVSLRNFETLSNPVRTQASNIYDFPLNITVDGTWVNVSTGIVNTTISGTVYEDNQLVIYKVDKVLLPLGIFTPRPKPKPLAPAPTPINPTKESSSSSSSTMESPVAALDASSSINLLPALARFGVLLVAISLSLGSS